MLLFLIAGCGQTPVASRPVNVTQPVSEAKPVPPAEPVAAKTAFWPMYAAAHQWAPDVVALRVTAREIPGYANGGGKAGLWEGVFASPSRGKYRVFTYSIATVAPSIFKGVTGGLEMPWTGVTREAMPLDLTMFNVDSDAAFSAASGDAAEWLKKNPGKQVATLEIGDTYRFPAPVWHVVWGTKASGYTTFVDASSGKIVKR